MSYNFYLGLKFKYNKNAIIYNGSEIDTTTEAEGSEIETRHRHLMLLRIRNYYN